MNYGYTKGYIGPFTETGEIIGTVPEYIINAETGIALPVTSMVSTFRGCEDLVIAPEFPKNVTELEFTFSFCSNLKVINIPETITRIGKRNFHWGSFESITIPSSVTSIDDYAFSCCKNLKSIEIPNSIVKIGEGAFSNCENLISINLPTSITSIGDDAFYYCRSLTSINIPNSVISIGSHAFSNCTSLTSVDIPNNVMNMGNAVFSSWTSSQIINCQITEANKPSGWSSYWDSYSYSEYNGKVYSDPRKAQLNWGVEM